LLGKGHRICPFDFGGKPPEIGPNHLFVLSSRAVNRMAGGRILDTSPDKRASIVTFRRKSIMKSVEETQDPVFRVV
jgi:hypothetical protein